MIKGKLSDLSVNGSHKCTLGTHDRHMFSVHMLLHNNTTETRDAEQRHGIHVALPQVRCAVIHEADQGAADANVNLYHGDVK